MSGNMEPAGFIARLTGPLLVVIGVGVLLNEANYAAIITEAAHSPTLIYPSGLLTLPLGLAILNVYRAWIADWRVIITIPRLALGDRRRHPHCAAAVHRDAGDHAVFDFCWPDSLRRRRARAGWLSQFRGVSLVDGRISVMFFSNNRRRI